MPSSDVWKYFDEFGEKAKCKMCKTIVARTQGSTHGMWKHLQSKHPESYDKIKGIGGENSGKQQQINIFTTPKMNEKEMVEEQIAGIMLRQNNAFSFFDDRDLKIILAKAYPHIQVNFQKNLLIN